MAADHLSIDAYFALVMCYQPVYTFDQRALAGADGPQMTTTSPLLTVRLQPRSTLFGPNDFETPESSIITALTSALPAICTEGVPQARLPYRSQDRPRQS